MVSFSGLDTVSAASTDHQTYRIVMEYVDGGDLLDYTMKKKGLCKRLALFTLD